MKELLELEEGYGKFVVALSNMLKDYEARIKALEGSTCTCEEKYEGAIHRTDGPCYLKPRQYTQADLNAVKNNPDLCYTPIELIDAAVKAERERCVKIIRENGRGCPYMAHVTTTVNAIEAGDDEVKK